jgi:hypothetical protein
MPVRAWTASLPAAIASWMLAFVSIRDAGRPRTATMTFARRLNHVENIPQQDSAERAFNKLARTFTTQMEALKRYRTGGQQKVTVEHVTVNAVGQAIVGAVAAGGGVANGNQRQPHAKALSHAPQSPLWSESPERELVPVTGDAER